MNNTMKSEKYGALIKQIERRRKWVIALTVTALLAVLAASSPLYIGSFNSVIIDYKGLHPLITVSLLLLITGCAVIAYIRVSAPLTTSMTAECDPEKNLILNTAVNKPRIPAYVCAVDFFYMGNFKAALDYADKMIAGKKPAMVQTGLFNKARCHFFAGDFDALKSAVHQYENALAAAKGSRKKTKDQHGKILKTMHLMIAIADENKEAIAACRNIEVWNSSKATQGFVNYLKGIAAYTVQDTEEAVRCLTSVKENCSKTFLAGLAEEYRILSQ